MDPPSSSIKRPQTVCLGKQGREEWLRRLSPRHVCARLLWVVENTLDPQLHARALDLVVALLHAEQQQAAPVAASQQQEEQQPSRVAAGEEQQQQQQQQQPPGEPAGVPATGLQASTPTLPAHKAATAALLDLGLLRVLQGVLQTAAQVRGGSFVLLSRWATAP